MKISNLVLRNFRKYETASFCFHQQFTILIGDNGAGKTTILDAVAIMLATYFQGSSIKTGRSTITKEDKRLIVVDKEEQVFLEPQKDVYLSAQGTLRGQRISWRRGVGDRGGKAKDLVSAGAADRDEISRGNSPDLPLLLYYGAGRLWDIHRHIETEGPSSQLDAYRFCLDPKSDQKAFQKWFKQLSFSAMQKGHPIPALSVVKDTVIACIPDATDFFHNIANDQPMIRFTDDRLMPFNNLSDGYRNMVAMVADIAHRASRLNPHFGIDAASQSAGIILIDEIDLHLHPKWQRRVVGDLQKAFPNIQFIATTHSPFIIQSTAIGELVDLNQPPMASDNLDIANTATWLESGTEYTNLSIEDIAEDVMGVEVPQRSHRYQEMYEAAKKYYTLLQEAASADQAQKEALKRKLDELSAPFSDNVAYHAFLEMKRIAAGLGDPEDQEDE